MKNLQNKIFLFFVLLLLVVQAIALWTLLEGNKIQEKQEIANKLATAKTIFTEQFNSQRDYLSAFAETAAQDYGIKQVFEDDTRSLLVALNNHRKRIDADLAMAISEQGLITAQLQVLHTGEGSSKVHQGIEHEHEFRFPNWLESQQQAHLYMLDGALYQLSLSPLTVGSKTMGWLAFGFQIDQRLAHHFLEITQLQIDFILKDKHDWLLIASSNEEAQLSFAKSIVDGYTPDEYIAIGHLVTEFDDQLFGLAMYGLRADFIAVLQKQWGQFLMLAIITMLLSLAGAYWIAASITKPIKRLVEQAKIIARGDYHQTININDQSELGQLADEFNLMQNAVLSREQAITHRANHDALTDLPNRNLLKLTLKDLTRRKIHFTLFHLNLSRIKDVNETLGHDVGDWLIKEAANRLAKIKGIQFLCHLGADEFILICKNCQDDNSVDLIISKIYQVLETNCDYQGISLQLQVRVGIASFPMHHHDTKILLQMADTALHHTRKTNQLVQIYSKALDVNSVERLSLINDLKHAISDNQLELYYQPKLNLSTGIATHVEALVRWRHPTLGLVVPDNFIHIAEQTGQINALTQWVVLTALKQFNSWSAEGIDINIAINISAGNLIDANFYHFICQALETTHVPPEKITLEITESAVVNDPDSAMALLRKFKAEGMRISIDDYGTGYSSLAQLKQLPVHELKIDKSFVQKLHGNDDDQIIVRSTIELAHNMGLSVVAEGIEDEFSLQWLTKQGCELGQGYFISRPQPVNKITAWLKEQEAYTPKTQVMSV